LDIGSSPLMVVMKLIIVMKLMMRLKEESAAAAAAAAVTSTVGKQAVNSDAFCSQMRLTDAWTIN